MANDVLYGRGTFAPYFNMQSFEDRIYSKTSTREKRIKTKKKLKIIDRLIMFLIVTLSVFLIIMSVSIIFRTVTVNRKDRDIEKLEERLKQVKYEESGADSILKDEMKLDELKMKAYMELNMITPTEKNIIHFNKSDSGFVRQYENIR